MVHSEVLNLNEDGLLELPVRASMGRLIKYNLIYAPINHPIQWKWKKHNRIW
jgi:hypothetical protein